MISYFLEGTMTMSELARLVECPFADKLKSFMVGRCDLSTENLDLLKKCAKLEGIGLGATDPTEELFIRLNQEHPGLKFLGLAFFAASTTPDDSARKALAALPIEELDVRGGVSDARFCEAIANLPNLKRLTIQTATLDDDAAAPLGRCPKLELLKLNFTGVTDKVLTSLDSLSSLNHLQVSASKITDEGAKQFVKRHPKCQVVTATGSF